MEIEAIKAFPICPDGTRTFEMAAGARLTVSDELGSGLIKAGLVRAVGQESVIDDDNPFLDDEEVEPEAPTAKPRAKRENKDGGSRSRRS